jgi:aspartyl-tRNA synthetase
MLFPGFSMLDHLAETRRTHSCGELRPGDAGKTVTLMGWVNRRRDHGPLIFVHLRDREGITQVVFNEEKSAAAHARAKVVRGEYVLAVTGRCVARTPETVNPNMATGEVEILAEEVKVLNDAQTPPFQIENCEAAEDLRLKYRYLDLRRPEMQRNLELRHRLALATRAYLDRAGFFEIETPILTKSTPEGARDYLVPSRTFPGRFFALPQSPQLFKQLLMIAGYDRYFQIARCFRDEDLRADRQPEFTQVDMEMSFVRPDDVFAVIEPLIVEYFKVTGLEPPSLPFPRMPYGEAMARFGSDKPDLRFGLEIQDATEITRGSEFGVFANAASVRYLVAPRAFSRAELQRLEELAKEWGAKGLAYLVVDEAGEVRSPIAKFLSERELEGFGAEPGSTVLFGAGEPGAVARVLGLLRVHLGRELELVDESRDEFLWVLDFPLFELDEETGAWTFSHHPFTGIAPGHEELVETDPGAVLSQAYDLVWNGWELGSGSIRIHRQDVQQRVFRALGLSEQEAREKFGFLLDALQMGAPPHGGFALGLDRFMALLAGEPNIREVNAFPKVSSGADPLTGAPAPVPDAQLEELGIRVLEPEK